MSKHGILGRLALTCGLLASLLPSARGQDLQPAVTAAARALAHQLDDLTLALMEIPGPPGERGFYRSLAGVQLDLGAFRQQILNGAGREALFLSFDGVDQKLASLLTDLQPFAQRDWGVKMVYKRTRAALHNLQFALASGSGPGPRQDEAARRQTLVLLGTGHDLEQTAKFVLDGQPPWGQLAPQFKAFRSALVTLQTGLQEKAARPQLKRQVEAVNDAWNTAVMGLQGLPVQQSILVQAPMVRVDGGVGRLSQLFGIRRGRPNLTLDY